MDEYKTSTETGETSFADALYKVFKAMAGCFDEETLVEGCSTDCSANCCNCCKHEDEKQDTSASNHENVDPAKEAPQQTLGASFYAKHHTPAKTSKEYEEEIYEAVAQYVTSALQSDSTEVKWIKLGSVRDRLDFVAIEHSIEPEYASFDAYLIDSIPSLILSDSARNVFLHKFDSSIYDDRFYDTTFIDNMEAALTKKLSKKGIAGVAIRVDASDGKHPKFEISLAFKKSK